MSPSESRNLVYVHTYLFIQILKQKRTSYTYEFENEISSLKNNSLFKTTGDKKGEDVNVGFRSLPKMVWKITIFTKSVKQTSKKNIKNVN